MALVGIMCSRGSYEGPAAPTTDRPAELPPPLLVLSPVPSGAALPWVLGLPQPCSLPEWQLLPCPLQGPKAVGGPEHWGEVPAAPIWLFGSQGHSGRTKATSSPSTKEEGPARFSEAESGREGGLAGTSQPRPASVFAGHRRDSGLLRASGRLTSSFCWPWWSSRSLEGGRGPARPGRGPCPLGSAVPCHS